VLSSRTFLNDPVRPVLFRSWPTRHHDRGHCRKKLAGGSWRVNKGLPPGSRNLAERGKGPRPCDLGLRAVLGRMG
jgi:hypothetical protein